MPVKLESERTGCISVGITADFIWVFNYVFNKYIHQCKNHESFIASEFSFKIL